MIGGGFSGNFPRRPGFKDKSSKLGVKKEGSSVSVPRGFTKSTHRVISVKNPFNHVEPSPPPTPPKNNADLPPAEVMWNGILHGYSGYSKANREILKRLSSFMRIGFPYGVTFNYDQADPETLDLWNTGRQTGVSKEAPRVTFLPPRKEPASRYRVIYTMMETEVVHKDMIKVMNNNYNECWTPTKWNADTFRKSGLTLPTYVMPLGVDPTIYTPNLPATMPLATLMTTHEAGTEEVPKGFVFIYVFQPTFRKGVPFLLSAFEEAFSHDSDAGLILGTTAYSLSEAAYLPNKHMRSRVWALSGGYTERDLASAYRACQAYVTTSHGEGWNLPLQESAACGLPVIAPRTSVHPEMIPDGHGLFFDADGTKTFPEAKKSSLWFDKIAFPDYGRKSKETLVEILRTVKKEYSAAKEMGNKYSSYVRSKFTWGTAARKVSDRLKYISK